MYSYYYAQRDALPVVVARFQNVYGPGEILGAGRWRGTAATIWRNVIPTFIYLALCGRGLPVEGQGESTRDFIYVADIVAGLLACAGDGRPGEAYNLASGQETSIRELAERVNALTGNRAGIEWRPARTWDRSGKRFGSTERAFRALGFTAGTALDVGLQQTIAWTQDQLPMIQACVRRHAAWVDM
jgi:nucleoside-diphosphate-sugar epimerase